MANHSRWCDMNAMSIGDDDVVVVLRMKAKDLSGLTAGIAMDIYEDSEFADALATPNDLEVVSIPTINTTLTGINPTSGIGGISVYPNPVSQNSIVEFSLENPGYVKMSLLSIIGTHVMDVTSGNFTAGNHKVAIGAANFKPGIYLLKIENTNSGNTSYDMVKIAVSY